MMVYRLTLDLADAACPASLSLIEGDDAGELRFSLRFGSEPFDPTGCVALLCGKKSDGTLFEYGTVIEEREVRLPLSPQMTSAAGICQCELRILTRDGTLKHAPRFEIDVCESLDGAVHGASENDVRTLSDLITETAAARDGALGAAADSMEAAAIANSAAAAARDAVDAAEDLISTRFFAIEIEPGNAALGQRDFVSTCPWQRFQEIGRDLPILLYVRTNSVVSRRNTVPATRFSDFLIVAVYAPDGMRMMKLRCVQGANSDNLEMILESEIGFPAQIGSLNDLLPLELALTAGDSALGQEDFVTLMSWSDFTALPADRQICLRFPYAGSQQTYAPASRQGNSLTVVFGVSGGIRLLDLYCVEGQSGKLELSVVTDLTLPSAITSAVNAAITAAIEGGY
ncbi:MAG: hypothetical protein IJU52_06830 [Clostridia bacterium]|nr:hypothetical protein [Clostridia bacterium]